MLACQIDEIYFPVIISILKVLHIDILTSNYLLGDLNNVESILRKGIYNIINGWRGILSFQYWKVFLQYSEGFVEVYIVAQLFNSLFFLLEYNNIPVNVGKTYKLTQDITPTLEKHTSQNLTMKF